jgi:DNA invertase Pin-like site-specific DNA recombinase
MLIGYARTSTTEQEAGLEGQIRDLQIAGCQRIFAEQVSATLTIRPKLDEALLYCRDGDTLVVTKPDRLARSTAHLLDIVEGLQKRDIHLRILSMGGGVLDTANATAKLLLTMLAAIAEFERTLMLERQKEGIAKAKGEGKYKGRVPTAMRQEKAVRTLVAEGKRPREIMESLNISRASLYRILKAA